MWKPWENESETQRIRRQKERYRDDKRWQIIDERKNDPMGRLHTRHRKKLMICGACVFLAMLLLIGRLGYVMIFQAQYYLSSLPMSVPIPDGLIQNTVPAHLRSVLYTSHRKAWGYYTGAGADAVL
jgi:hypothetical protein